MVLHVASDKIPAKNMPKLTEAFAKKTPVSPAGTAKHWDTEIKGLVLFVGKRSKTWYFQKDVAGKTKRILLGRSPAISAATARQAALELSVQMARGTGKLLQVHLQLYGLPLKAISSVQGSVQRHIRPG